MFFCRYQFSQYNFAVHVYLQRDYFCLADNEIHSNQLAAVITSVDIDIFFSRFIHEVSRLKARLYHSSNPIFIKYVHDISISPVEWCHATFRLTLYTWRKFAGNLYFISSSIDILLQRTQMLPLVSYLQNMNKNNLLDRNVFSGCLADCTSDKINFSRWQLMDLLE